MLTAAFRTSPSSSRLVLVASRALATESIAGRNSHHEPLPPPPPPASLPQQNSGSSYNANSSSSNSTTTNSKPRSYLHPPPRPPHISSALSHRHPSGPNAHAHLPRLPPTFGRNQLLPVADSTRALLESIVAKFNAPIRYAFAYGSGVFEQDGYSAAGTAVAGKEKEGQEVPMLDFMFAVTHPEHFHSINMQQHPAHYPLHARMLGSGYIAKVEDLGPGVWFNAYVPMNGVVIKYGVTSVDNLCNDLLNWRTLYLAGRMHKPLRIIKDDARVRLTQQVNLTSAVRAALLTLPSTFSETQLFETITGISYSGDPRMLLPAENRGKIGNIVRKQGPQFKELYQRLVVGLPGTHWSSRQREIQQDTSPKARSYHLRKLPHGLRVRLQSRFEERGLLEEGMREDENAYWMKFAADEKVLDNIMREEMSRIVRGPATVQSLKGIVTAGVGKSLKYSSAKIGKWWSGS